MNAQTKCSVLELYFAIIFGKYMSFNVFLKELAHSKVCSSIGNPFQKSGASSNVVSLCLIFLVLGIVSKKSSRTKIV